MSIFRNKVFNECFKDYPIKLVDIGASGGLQKHWKKAEEFLEVVFFEPDKRSYDHLASDNSKKKLAINSALYKTKGLVEFRLTEKPEVSSIFPPNEDFLKQFPESERFQSREVQEMNVDTLDSLLKINNVTGIDFIKLDVQGAELAVLEGSGTTLKNVLGLEVEVEFAEVYKGQPLFSDVDQFMRSNGFQLFDLKPHYWKRACGVKSGGVKGQLIFADSVYFLNLKRLKSLINNIENANERKAKVLKAISIALLYGYSDYALAIFQQHETIFSDREVSAFYDMIYKKIGFWARIPDFRGKIKLAKVFFFLFNLFRPTHNRWATTGEELGNMR